MKPTKEITIKIKDLLKVAKKEKIGNRLAELLSHIDNSQYDKAIIITDIKTYCKPYLSDNQKTVMLRDSDSDEITDIDKLSPQFRWDAVCAIWNEIEY